QWFQTSYSMWFNRKYRRVGALFQGRCQAVVVDPPAWGLALLLCPTAIGRASRVGKSGIFERSAKRNWRGPRRASANERTGEAVRLGASGESDGFGTRAQLGAIGAGAGRLGPRFSLVFWAEGMRAKFKGAGQSFWRSGPRNGERGHQADGAAT